MVDVVGYVTCLVSFSAVHRSSRFRRTCCGVGVLRHVVRCCEHATLMFFSRYSQRESYFVVLEVELFVLEPTRSLHGGLCKDSKG